MIRVLDLEGVWLVGLSDDLGRKTGSVQWISGECVSPHILRTMDRWPQLADGDWPDKLRSQCDPSRGAISALDDPAIANAGPAPTPVPPPPPKKRFWEKPWIWLGAAVLSSAAIGIGVGVGTAPPRYLVTATAADFVQ